MAHRIVWTPQAAADLEEIAEFIAADSPVHASRTVRILIERFQQAAVFPYSGRVVPEYSNDKIRELIWRNYRLVYQVEAEAIVVIAVHQGHRMLDASS